MHFHSYTKLGYHPKCKKIELSVPYLSYDRWNVHNYRKSFASSSLETNWIIMFWNLLETNWLLNFEVMKVMSSMQVVRWRMCTSKTRKKDKLEKLPFSDASSTRITSLRSWTGDRLITEWTVRSSVDRASLLKMTITLAWGSFGGYVFPWHLF